MYRAFFKRIFDFTVSLLFFSVILPVFIVLVLLVFISNRGPVFFTQERPGLNGKIFRLIKLRTMNDNRDETGKLLPDRNRLTRIGRMLRSLSLDELPQFMNILMGDMSIVGPRPLLTSYLPLYNSRQARRHEVRPGITGWAQVNGRNDLSWEEKFEYDVWYVDNISFWLDISIFFKTIFKVIKREGINSKGTASMSPFKGSLSNNK